MLSSLLSRRQFLIAGGVWTAATACARMPVVRLGSSSPPREGPPVISLAAMGDVTLGHHLERYLDEQAALGVPLPKRLAYPFDKVRPILEMVDVAVVNLECPFTERGEALRKNFTFRARPELVGVLQAAGIHAVTLANNHVMDFGADGLLDTIDTLDEAGIVHFGAGRNLAEARRPAVISRGGVTVGFLGYVFLGSRDIEPEEVRAGADRPGAAGTYRDLPGMERMLAEDLAALRGKVDVPVVYWHWGREGRRRLEPYQVRLGHLSVDEGARLVLGSHPHVLQGMEWYRNVPIIYSLGNFVFGGNANPRRKASVIYKATISQGSVVTSEVIPVQITRVPQAPFQPFPLRGEHAERIMGAVARAPLHGRTLPELERYRAVAADTKPPDAPTIDDDSRWEPE
jgi:poly-gamma-glutamate capsule biosynthesis protein CapA/YwtB (metallophosphatase superfamily)